MFSFFLSFHSVLRWLVLVALFFKIAQAFMGWRQKREWSVSDKKASLGVLILVDIQLLLGLVLQFALSPTVRVAMQNMKTTMKNKLYRFWAVEHISLMFFAIVLIHVGFSLAKRKSDSIEKHKTSFFFFSVALVLIIASIPWPFREIGRSLLPFLK